MAILDKIKYGIDLPRWQQMSPMLNAHAAGGCVCSDKRNELSCYDAVFHLASAAILNVYYGPPNGAGFIANPGLTAFGAGSAITFVPSMTYTGTITAGSTATSLILSTFGATVPLNGLVLTEGLGFKIRVIDNAAGGSGKTEERFITGNTLSATPTVYLNATLSFTPTAGSAYEIMAGSVYCLGTGATSATQFRKYRIGLGDMVSCATTGLTIATESAMTALDEQYVPYLRKAGEGFVVGTTQYDNYLTAVTTLYDKYCNVNTGISASAIAGQAASGDFAVITNEFRNFQIRIVEDTAIPTSVGQRRIIASHTGSGVTPVYTLGSAWSVTPSASGVKYVIELPNQILLSTVAANTATYTYNTTPYTINNGTNSILTNAWSSTYYGARATAVAAGTMLAPAWGHEPTLSAAYTHLSRHSYIYSFRGGSTTIDLLDIAGGTTGTWTNAIAYNAQQTALGAGTCGDYAPFDQQGRWFYFNLNATSQMFRFDVKYLSLYPWCNTPTQTGTAAVGQRVAVSRYGNLQTGGTDIVSKVHLLSHLATTMYRSEVII